MTALLDDQVHVLVDLGHDGIVLPGPDGLGKDGVQQGKCIDVGQIAVPILLYFLGQVMQDPLHFPSLVFDAVLQFVVQRDDLSRFHVGSLAGGTGAVMQAVDGILEVVLDQHNAAVVSGGDDVILQPAGMRAHVLAQAGSDLQLGLLLLLSDFAQGYRSVVIDLTGGIDALEDAGSGPVHGFQGIGEIFDAVLLPFRTLHIFFDSFNGIGLLSDP